MSTAARRNPCNEPLGPTGITDDPGFHDLLKHYLDHQLVLYTGAGVSRNADGLGIGDWDGFLGSVVNDHLGAAAASEYQADVSHRDPWDRAEWLAHPARLGRQQLNDAIYRKVRSPGVFKRGKYNRLLEQEFVRGAPTLRTLAAFSVDLVGYSRGQRGGHTVFYPRVAANSRVPAVLSTNYDPYLEAAASSMFRTLIRTHPLKPVGEVGSTAGRSGQTPVFHVHGYVPPEADDIRRPIVNPVLTKADYIKAWADRADSYTIGPQIHLLRHYSALFIGFSFRDEWVNALLKQVNAERAEASARRRDPRRLTHFAMLSAAEVAQRSPTFYTDLGITVIPWHDAEEISEALAALYQTGLANDLRERAPLLLAEYETVRGGSGPTGRATIVDDDEAPAYVWRNLERAWHNPLDAEPPGRTLHTR